MGGRGFSVASEIHRRVQGSCRRARRPCRGRSGRRKRGKHAIRGRGLVQQDPTAPSDRVPPATRGPFGVDQPVRDRTRGCQGDQNRSLCETRGLTGLGSSRRPPHHPFSGVPPGYVCRASSLRAPQSTSGRHSRPTGADLRQRTLEWHEHRWPRHSQGRG